MSWIKTGFVAAFFALSVLPVLQWTTGFIDVSALDEKRRLAPPPDVAATVLHGDGRLSAAINQWFDDRYGFRPLLVRLKNQLDYWAFRHSDKIFIGSDDWLYQPGFFQAPINAEREGDAGAERLHQKYLELARYLDSRGVRLIVISNPDKESTYPQYLPRAIPHLPKPDRYQKLRAWLKSRNEFDYIDGDDVLANCKGYRIFHKLDIHMLMPGGVCFAEAMIAQMAKAEGRSKSPWDHTFNYTEVTSAAGGQAAFLSLLVPLSEAHYSPDHMFFDDNDPLISSDPSGVFEYIYHAKADASADLLPPVVLFGDSFLDLYRVAGFQTYVSAAYRARDDGSNITKVLDHIPEGTRYFVFQFLEPYVNVLISYKIPEPGATKTGGETKQ